MLAAEYQEGDWRDGDCHYTWVLGTTVPLEFCFVLLLLFWFFFNFFKFCFVNVKNIWGGGVCFAGVVQELRCTRR